MASPAPEPLTDVPPPARDTVATLIAAPTVPVKLLVSGGIGTGKSSVLAVVRSTLRAAGVPVVTRPPRDGDDPALVVAEAVVQLGRQRFDVLAALIHGENLLHSQEHAQRVDPALPVAVVVLGTLDLAGGKASEIVVASFDHATHSETGARASCSG